MATHLKRPTLSKTSDMTMVERIVKEGPLTSFSILLTSVKGTIPNIISSTAPIVVGMVSFSPKGFQIINSTVKKKMIRVKLV